jgi:hypothetical protein
MSLTCDDRSARLTWLMQMASIQMGVWNGELTE